MKQVDVVVPDRKKPPLLKFPARCVHCGKPKDEDLGLSLDMGVQKRSRSVTMKMSVPMCKDCANRERSIAKVTLVPFLIAGALIGIAAFIPAAIFSPEGNTPQTLGFPVVFGGFVGLIVGAIGGTVVELIVKLLAAPFYGRGLMKRPLTIFGLYSNGDELIGVSARYLHKEKIVRLEFENDEIAFEFIKLNDLENL